MTFSLQYLTDSQPPEILKASMLWDTYNTNLHSLFDFHHVVLSIRDHSIAHGSFEQTKAANRQFE